MSLEGDTLSPYKAVEAFGESLFEADAMTRWHYTDAEVPEGASNDHIDWVRTPSLVVAKVKLWWDGGAGSDIEWRTSQVRSRSGGTYVSIAHIE